MISSGIRIVRYHENDKSKVLPFSSLNSFDSGKTEVLFASDEFDSLTKDPQNKLLSVYHDRLSSWYPDTYRKLSKSYNINGDIWNGIIIQNIENFMKKLMNHPELKIHQIKETIGANGYSYYIIKYEQ